MLSKQDLEREKMLQDSALRIFLIRDPVITAKILDRIDDIDEDLKNGNYKDHEDRSG